MNAKLLNEQLFWFRKSNSKKQEQLKYRLLKHLYAHGPSPVAALCDTLGISTPTAVKLLSEMSRERIVEKKGQGESVGGRRPDLFRLRKHVL